MNVVTTGARGAAPPTPRGLPFLGNGLDYMRDPLGFLERAAREHGDLVELRFPAMSAYLVSDPAAIERILVTENRSYMKDRFTRELKRVLREGLLTSEGEQWRRQRRLANPAFHKERVAGYAAIMTGAAEAVAARFHEGETRDVHDDMMELTLEIITKVLFSAHLGADGAIVADALAAVQERFADPVLGLFPFLDRLPTPGARRFRRAALQLDSILYRLIRQRRESMRGPASAPAGDLLGMLLEARDEDGGQMSDEELRDELMTLFIAGHETTALALGWAFHLLSEHPAADEALAAELGRVLGDVPAGLGHLPDLRYTEAVILESMRLYPPAWAMGREAIVPVEIAGHRLPAGAQVWFAQWVVHRDRRWFDDPAVFRPERWLGEPAVRRPRFAYFPFGGGPRLCIGQSFAMMEAVLALATIARRYRLLRKPDHKVELFPAITLRPRNGLPLIVETRTPPPAART